MQNITETEKDNLLSKAIEQVSEIVVITDTHGNIQYVNPAFEKLTGYSCREAIGQNPKILHSGQHDRNFYKTMWETLQKGNTWIGHFINKSKNGRLFEEKATISPVRNSQGTITNYVAVKRDLSKELSLEKQLRHAMKMEAIGTLAGGIAHDFNNILTAILGHGNLAKHRLPKNSPIEDHLDQIIIASKRAAKLVEQILTFSRQEDGNFETIALQPVLREVVELLKPTLPATIHLQSNIASDTGPVFADPVQIQQVLMNICTNAKHAIGQNSGVLNVALSQINVTDNYNVANSPLMAPGSYINIKISDTGCGMDQFIQSKIFDPFFTTKENGTGLGLSVAHGIITQHKGTISIGSKPGQGTSFNIYLPVSEKRNEPEEKDIPVNKIQQGSERILFVDDEPTIADMMKQTLCDLGYTVTIFTNSLQALNEFQKKPDKFDLVITDMTMPELTGVELASQLLKTRPELSIILCTGHSNSMNRTKALSLGIAEYLKKPFDLPILSKTIKKVLKEPC